MEICWETELNKWILIKIDASAIVYPSIHSEQIWESVDHSSVCLFLYIISFHNRCDNYNQGIWCMLMMHAYEFIIIYLKVKFWMYSIYINIHISISFVDKRIIVLSSMRWLVIKTNPFSRYLSQFSWLYINMRTWTKTMKMI